MKVSMDRKPLPRHKRKRITPIYKQFKLLLDTAFAAPRNFKKLYKAAHLEHIRFTYKQSPTVEDKHIYELATREKCIVITIDEDFKRLHKENMAGVFIIPAYLDTDGWDKLICKFIKGKNPDVFWGKVEKL